MPDICNEVYRLLFADDAKFLCVGLDTKAFQDDLNNIFNWTLLNEMPFNLEKCAHIAIPKTKLLFGNALIEPAVTQPDLGLHFSGDLKWNLHTDKNCGKANQEFQMIKNVSFISSSAKLYLYKSMIVPILVYGSPCYGLSKYTISQLENTQKRIVQWIIPRKKVVEKEKLEKLSILLPKASITYQIFFLALLSVSTG